MQKLNTLFGALLLTATALLHGPAQAETRYEFWAASEVQLTLSPETDPNLAWHDVIPDRLRLYTEHQFFTDIGLQQALYRVGPIWNLLPWLTYSMHLTSAVQPTSENQFNQEVRLEMEPTFRGAIFPELIPGFRWANRHRFEYRMRSDRQFWRYRTRLVLNYHFPDTPLTTFASNEFHFELNERGFNQNRAMLGVGWQINDSTQLSLGYLNRMVLSDGQWNPEHGLVLNLIYSSREDGIFQMQAD